MLRRCGRSVLHVLGLSFPLLTRRPLFLCPHRLMKPLVVFVLGGPGAGKGTQCARIVEGRPFFKPSVGETGRNLKHLTSFKHLGTVSVFTFKVIFVQLDLNCGESEYLQKQHTSSYSKMTWEWGGEGKIGSLVAGAKEMDQTMAANAQKNKFLIDGFPRNQDNLQGWNKTMDGKADVSFVLFFDCNNEICIERCLERGKSSGRSDDNRESLEKRIQTYLQSTKPIIDLYEEMGKVKKIDASKSVDEVFDQVMKIFDKEG
ncbi:hypothetical protein GH733_015373 [Mirounga leonina]|nr:hypothetical protein GH733_015373 [Mirounga leonina]